MSRQSVSKWESEQAYPEMDKILQICKMFNLNIDELLNQDIKEVNERKESKNKVNKFVDDMLNFVNKTVKMFCNMRFKDVIKCLFEQAIVLLILWILINIFGSIFKNIVSPVLNMLPDNI